MQLRTIFIILILSGCSHINRDKASLNPNDCATNFIDLIYQNRYLEMLNDQSNEAVLALQYKDMARLYNEGNDVSENNLSALSDALTVHFYQKLKSRGLTIQLKEMAISSSDLRKTKVITLDLYSETGLKQVPYLAKMMGATNLQFSLLGSTLMKRDGFYFSPNRMIGLHLTNHFDILAKDSPTHTFRHELSHANFDLLRRKGKDSIFFAHYRYTKASAKNNYAYNAQMSLEELYNFAAEPYWIKRDLNEYQGELSNLLIDLYHKQIALSDLKVIAKQVQETSLHFVESFRNGSFKIAISPDKKYFMTSTPTGAELIRYISPANKNREVRAIAEQVYREQIELHNLATDIVVDQKKYHDLINTVFNKALDYDEKKVSDPKLLDKLFEETRKVNIALRKLAVTMRKEITIP